MPYSEAERKEVQMGMFGCLTEDIDAAVADSGGNDGLEVAMSMLSDAQEQIARADSMRGSQEQARQTINRAKYLINKERQAKREAEKK